MKSTVGHKKWVKVRWIMDVTGWNKADLRRARKDGVVETSVSPTKGLLYNIDSIPERLLITKKA